MKKNIILFIGLISVVLSSFIGSANATNIVSTDYDEYIKRNEKMLEVAKKLNDGLLDENGEYPSYYGGMYINDDATNLVLQIVKRNLPKMSNDSVVTTEEISSLDKSIIIEYVDHPYNELFDLYEKINDYYENVDNIVTKAEFKNYTGHYVDIKNNDVVVNLYDRTAKYSLNSTEQIEELIPMFKEKVIDSELLRFELKDEGVNETTSIRSGQIITVNGGTCSMGYRVKIDGKVGYITAAHCFSGLNETILTGTVKKYQYSGSVDAAFVQTKSSYTPLNELKYTKNGITKLNNTMCPIAVVGSAIAHVGVTTQYQEGKILSTKASLTYNGIKLSNLITSNYKSDNGDSGGAVFIPSSNGEGLLVGIHNGAAGNTKYIVNADYIYSAFKYSRY